MNKHSWLQASSKSCILPISVWYTGVSNWKSGPLITTATWRCSKEFILWQHIFYDFKSVMPFSNIILLWRDGVRKHHLLIIKDLCIGIRSPSQYPKRSLSVRSRKVSKPRDLYLELSDRYDIWQALRQQCCRCACQISKRYDNLKYQSRGFETLRDLTERRLCGYWDGAQVSTGRALSVGYNYLSLPLIHASGTRVLNWCSWSWNVIEWTDQSSNEWC